MLAAIVAVVAAIPSDAHARTYRILTPAQTGVSADALSGTHTSSEIKMEEGAWSNQVTWLIDIVRGTSDVLTVQCFGKHTSSGSRYPIPDCTGVGTQTCIDKLQSYDLTGGQTEFMMNVPVNYPILECDFDDPGAGSGTVSATAVRGVQ